MRGGKRFSEHHRASCWSSRNELKPEDVALATHKVFWFNCPDCLHEFQSSPHMLQQVWCGYCHKKKLCDKEDCKYCYEISFASSDKAKYWSAKNSSKPRYVFKCSSKKYWFKCETCNHEFDSILSHIKDTWCPYCVSKKLCDNIECQICFNKSFASEEKAKYWSLKNSINPRDVFKVSRKKYLFDCEICSNIFEKRLDHIAFSKSWCPNCFNKTELKLYSYLKQHFEVLKNVKYDWCKNDKTGRKLEYDFVIPELKLIVELDGRQHFTQISNWRCPNDQLVSDVYKTKCANDNGYKVIRLLQEEVFYNDSSWLDSNLKPLLVKLSSNVFVTVDSKYKSIYDKHILGIESSLERIRLDGGV
jgi:very-short-patch-repair endonuclease